MITLLSGAGTAASHGRGTQCGQQHPLPEPLHGFAMAFPMMLTATVFQQQADSYVGSAAASAPRSRWRREKDMQNMIFELNVCQMAAAVVGF